MKEKKLIFGVGFNDADYITRTSSWTCPFFRKWKDMLCRCYSEYEQKRSPTYLGCYVVTEWLYFSKFKLWMESQPWEGNVLDKDILVPGNKVYSPDTCVFVSTVTNGFIVEKSKSGLIVGVSKHKDKYQARCGDSQGEQKYLGVYETPELAHKAWLQYKLEQARILATKQTDVRVAKALIDRYENYRNYFC